MHSRLDALNAFGKFGEMSSTGLEGPLSHTGVRPDIWLPHSKGLPERQSAGVEIFIGDQRHIVSYILKCIKHLTVLCHPFSFCWLSTSSSTCFVNCGKVELPKCLFCFMEPNFVETFVFFLLLNLDFWNMESFFKFMNVFVCLFAKHYQTILLNYFFLVTA